MKLWLRFSPSMSDVWEGSVFANPANTVLDDDPLIPVAELPCGLFAHVQYSPNSLLGHRLNMQDQEMHQCQLMKIICRSPL